MALLRFLLIVFCASASSSSSDIFVSPAGSDAGPGSETQPFATLERARDAIRTLKHSGSLPAAGINIHLRGGDYPRSQPLELTDADSGAPGAPIVWRRYQDETPRLLGGRILNQFQPVSDPAVLQRFGEAARPHILQCDARALGLAEAAEMKSRGFARPTTPAHPELFFAQKPMTLARWPNEGKFERIAGFPETSGQGDDHGGTLGRLDAGFIYAGDRPRGWQPSNDIWVHGYWAWDWANSYERIASLDLAQRRIITASPHGLYGFRKGQRFYFLNILEELDQPGEWFLDHASRILYFWPPNPIVSGETVLSLLDQPLLRLTGASHVTIRGLSLEATRSSAIEIRDGAGIRIVGCRIRNIGNHGITVQGGANHGILSCDIFDTGDGGVSLTGGDRQTLAPGGHFVENCHFQRQGRWSKCYVPAIHLEGVGLRASRNLIHDHPHAAILYWGNDHLMEFNEIHHIALETGDVGAIYTGRDYSFRGNRIRHNFIHHTGGVGMGSMGAYMDDCVSGAEIHGNIFYKVQRAAFLGGGRDHLVVNNIFVDCDPAVQVDGRGLNKSPVWRNMVDKTMRERLNQIPLSLYRERYPEMTSLDRYYGPPQGPAIDGAKFQGVPPEGNLVARNLCSGKWLSVHWHAEPTMVRVENNLTSGDLGWASPLPSMPRAKDFRLRPDSPAWKIGFQPLPLDKIGLYQDESRPPSSRIATAKSRRILYNLDGDSCMTLKAGRKGPGPITTLDLTNIVAELTQPGSQVDSLLVCVNAQVLYYPSAVGTMRGHLSTPEERAKWSAHEKQRFENMRAFFDGGVDPYAVLLNEARRRGLEALLTFRMNDAHGNDFLRTAFWEKHPEFRLGNGALDFGREAVRDYVFALIQEAVQRYDCDGLELDFQRFPTFFRTGSSEENTAKINDLVQRVRQMLDAEGAKRGRRLILSARVPSDYGQGRPTYEQARVFSKACDPAAWASRGWIDFLTVSEWLFTADTLNLKAWREHAPGVPIYGAIQPETKPSPDPSRCEFCLGADGYRRLARERWSDGADGIYLFNFFTTREWPNPIEPPFEVLSQIGARVQNID